MARGPSFLGEKRPPLASGIDQRTFPGFVVLFFMFRPLNIGPSLGPFLVASNIV